MGNHSSLSVKHVYFMAFLCKQSRILLSHHLQPKAHYISLHSINHLYCKILNYLSLL
ncbi:hypothetical protein BDB01DRAFT_800324 [Pilobolus umbonatus]|nr:hypothetical protein BDB01DRAFT_811889 [Pilobolus umbonatus]KAI8977997.1 hypothetical protein BDB01DRAFT_800324 [Pilobolus umbonatus]